MIFSYTWQDLRLLRVGVLTLEQNEVGRNVFCFCYLRNVIQKDKPEQLGLIFSLCIWWKRGAQDNHTDRKIGMKREKQAKHKPALCIIGHSMVPFLLSLSHTQTHKLGLLHL